MAVRHGYGKIAGTDALVFAYDTGDTRNSYRGEPTINLAPSGSRTGTAALPRQSYHIRAWTYSIETNVAGRDSVIRLYINPPGTDTTAPYADYGFQVYKAGGSQVGDVYTISMDYYVVKGNSTPGITIAYANGYKSPTSAQAASWGSVEIIDLGKGWYRRIQSATITEAGNTWWRGGIGSNNIETEVYIDNIQVELNSHATPFVDGTRSATEGLLDLTGNKTISLTNTSFDTNAQPAFDGTEEYFDLGSDQVFKTSGGWTVENIVRYDSVAGGYDNYISPANFIGSDSISYNSWYWSVLSNKLALWNISPGIWKYGSTTIQPNTWYHVALVSYDSGTQYQMYLNGVAEGGDHTTYSWNATYSGLRVRYIGAGQSTRRFVNGEIPVTKIYNRALTAAEILNNYNQYKGRFNI